MILQALENRMNLKTKEPINADKDADKWHPNSANISEKITGTVWETGEMKWGQVEKGGGNKW